MDLHVITNHINCMYLGRLVNKRLKRCQLSNISVLRRMRNLRQNCEKEMQTGKRCEEERWGGGGWGGGTSASKLTRSGFTLAITRKTPAYSALLIHIFDPLMT